MPTAGDLVERTRVYLDGSTRDPLNELASAVAPTDTNIVLAHPIPNVIDVGTVLSIGKENVFVWSWNPGTQTAGVRRGFGGTSAIVHSAADLVRINPRFTDADVFNALNTALNSLNSAGLFGVQTITRFYSWQVKGLDLATDMIGDQVQAVSYLTMSGLHEWKEVFDYQVRLNVSTSDYPSGKALFITAGLPDTTTVRLTYQSVFAPLVNLADDVVATTGLPDSAIDLPPIGAAIELMAGQPLQRAQTSRQPQGRNPTEVSTSDVLNSTAALRQRWAQRLKQETDNQDAQWPIMLKRWAL